jgi:hypothetical protein
LATLYDIFQRQVEAGDAIILKNLEAQPVIIVEIGELAIQPGPGAPPMRVVKMLVDVTLMIPMEQPVIPAYLVKKGEKKISSLN